MRARATINGMGIVVRLIVSAIALWISTLLISGIKVEGGAARQAGTLLIVAVIFGVVNAVLRPLIKMVGCWAYVLTLGLVALVVNGAGEAALARVRAADGALVRVGRRDALVGGVAEIGRAHV